MPSMKMQIRWAWRLEIMATGFYRTMAQHHADMPKLAAVFEEFGKDEFMHAGWYNHLHFQTYGKKMNSQNFWLWIGRMVAGWLRKKDLDTKLEQVSETEWKAVRALEKGIEKGPPSPFWEIAQRTLPDEQKHAEWFRRWYFTDRFKYRGGAQEAPAGAKLSG